MTDQNRGVLFTLGAFVLWGLVPIYFKLLTGVEAFEILAHRIIWSVLALVAVMLLLKRSILVKAILKKPELRRTLFISAILISVNWLIFAWAVTHDQILATSLGYFINPLVSVMLGMIVLGERLSRNQYLALMLVVLAIANQIWSFGELPWVALSLALSFGFYGLLRKRADVDAYNGLLVEVLLMLPFAMAYLLWKMQAGTLVFTQQSTMMDINLFLSGLVTTIPLVLFAAGAKLIRLSIVGFIQYIAPSITFLLAVLYYNEPLGVERLISFVLIWVALILISIDAYRENRRARRKRQEENSSSADSHNEAG